MVRVDNPSGSQSPSRKPTQASKTNKSQIMKTLLSVAALLATTVAATAQSTVVGINLRGGANIFTSDVTQFVTNFVAGSPTSGETIFAIDYDATATNLWGVDWDTGAYGTIDVPTGLFTMVGTSNFPLTAVRGITAHPNGTTWYAAVGAGAGTDLWMGDITTGTFALVGNIDAVELLIDLSCDSMGNVFATGISTDSLWSIDTTTGLGTSIGTYGVNTNFAQGIDFDWATDTLYATLYVAGGVGEFVSFDLATGAILTSDPTTALNAEMEMAVQAGVAPGVGTPFCNPNDPNSTGMSTNLTAAFGTGVGSDLHLDSNQGPSGQFGYFLVGTAPNEPGIMLPGSQGRLCLLIGGGNSLGRYNVTGTNFNSLGRFDAGGLLQNVVGTSVSGSGFDVPSTVPISGSPMIMTGQVWHFQLWHREAGGLSNFSNGLSVTF